ncbi:MAG: sulfatase-like hydrolase/transferase [Woeseiaceae bacterium]|nr:sulfatase-like hydrolase/transferase [Woeseiaceae bacterium]
MSITRRDFLKASATATAGAMVAPGAAAESIAVRDPGWRPRTGVRKPNIIVVVLDDVGFADLGCYGAEHRTPCIDGLAAGGTRFNNFHVTALCAPTRACLLTGRNAHAVGVGNIAEWGRDHPGYRGWIRQDAMTLAEILKPGGYSTIATGKWHLSSLADQNGTGPFDHWPVRRGFDHWYGFHGNAIDHWHPEMFENTSAAYPEKTEDYHLSADLVDRSIHYVGDHLAASPDRPFFLYLAFGAMHFPLHAPIDDIRRYRGRYDAGWDVIRAERFRRQLELGIVPDGTEPAPRNPDVPAWTTLSDDQRLLAARGQEVYAAFVEHTDRQLERLVDFLKREQAFDDTILMVLSDNGAAYGGPIEGRLDVRRDAYLGAAPIEEFLKDIDLFGSEASYPMYSRGWAQAGNSPLKWYKADTYEGGIRSPLVVSWPNGELPAGAINTQYHHAIDVVPTVLNMIDESMPKSFRGKSPLPVQGTSFAYTFDQPKAPTKKTVQYFETLGDRAIWADGWKAVARHTPGTFEDDTWELYHAAEDFAETNNLADEHPRRLADLKMRWLEEAERYDVLPMDDDTLSLYQQSVPAPRATYVFYPGMTRLDRLSAPDIYSYDSQFKASVSGALANGVILAAGDSSCGYEWFLKDGHVHFGYVFTRNAVYTVRSDEPVPSDTRTLGVEIRKTGESSGMLTLTADGTAVAELELPSMWPIYAANAGIRCGENRHAPVTRDYEQPFVFDGRLERVVVDVTMP